MSLAESPAELLARLEAMKAEEAARRGREAVGVAVAITGGRDHIPTSQEIEAFWRLFDGLRGNALHHGDARGVDRHMAAVVRRARPVLPIIAHPADWRPGEGELDRAAGIKRNLEMLSKVRALIVFPGGRGTAHCQESARRAGLVVRVVWDELMRCDHVIPAWRWEAREVSWLGDCRLCGMEVIATKATARRLEAEVAEHVEKGRK